MQEPASAVGPSEPGQPDGGSRAPVRALPPAARPGVVLGLYAATTAADFHLGPVPFSSAVFTAVQTALLIPWLTAVFSSPVTATTLRGRRTEPTLGRRLRVAAARATGTSFLVLALAAKWLVLAAASHQEAVFAGSYRTYAVAAFVAYLIGHLGRAGRVRRFLLESADHPARLAAISFGLAGLVGGFLLTLPPSLRRITDASFVDGLFMAYSAVCVTGLAVRNVADTYTPFGQAVLLLLIQLGGLGIMVLSAALTLAMGRRLRIRDSAVLAQMVDADSLAALRRSVVAIVAYSFAIEAAGAALLWFELGSRPEVALGAGASHPLAGAGSRLWAAVFHSVSAFCNAGFSLFREGLAPLGGSWTVLGTVMAIIVLGGLGAPVLHEVASAAAMRLRRRRPPRLSLHARVVLSTSAVLVAGLAAAFLVLEWAGALDGASPSHRLLTALFQSVTSRTAGFSTVDFGAVRPATLLVVAAAMLVGASPGSTGGGFKTTTLAALFAAFRAELRGRPAPRLFDRTVPTSIVHRAALIWFAGTGVLLAVFLALLLTETHEPLSLFFEAASALTTTGLSTGVTPRLTAEGKLVLVVAMVVGRIGPLTAALSLAERRAPVRYSLPEERIAMG